MTNTVFRTATPTISTPATEVPKGDGLQPVLESEVAVPYSEFAKEKGHSYVLEHYDLGHLVNRGDLYDAKAYEGEVESIDAYINHQIQKGEVNNTLESVKNELKRIEKLSNVKTDARGAMKLQLVAEYAKFLLNSEGIKLNAAKYRL